MSKHQNQQQKGIAILSTLMILSLLLALIGAFLVVNRAGNQFTINSVERRQAQDVALTVYSYAMYELERNRQWSSVASPMSGSEEYPFVQPQVKMTLSQDGVNGKITGVYSPGGNFASPLGTVEATIRNNLQESTPLPGVVPPRAVAIEVTVRIGDKPPTSLRALLKPKVPSHESLAAGGNINLDGTAGLVRIESKDPYVNRISANGDLNLPNPSEVQFLRHGIGQSGEALNVGGLNLASATEEQRRVAGDHSGGTYLPHKTLDLQEFDGNELELPESKDNDLESGVWTFGDVINYEYIPHNLSYQQYAPGPMGPVPAGTGNVTRYQEKKSTYNLLTSPSGKHYPAGTAIAGTTVLNPPYPPSGGTYSDLAAAESYGFDNSQPGGMDNTGTPLGVKKDVHNLTPSGKIKANVVTAQMVIHSGTEANLSGDFIVVGEGDRKPEMYFGYDLTAGGVAVQQSLINGLEAAKSEPAKYMAGIKAGGNVNVTGGVVGYGSMLAGGDLTIKASSGLRSAPGLGVVIKGNRVLINPATELEPELPGEPIDADYTIFRDAIQAESGGDWAPYNSWLEHESQDTRDNIVSSLSGQTTGLSASSLWSTLDAQIGGGGSLPSAMLSANGWSSGNLTVDRYMRLKEFYQTVASGYNDGAGDSSWLDLSVRQDDSAGRVSAVLDGIAYWARSYKETFAAYLTNPDASIPDMFLEGLVYADDDIIINAQDKSVKLVGAVIARNGDITVNDASSLTAVYDRHLLDDLYSVKGSGPIDLERIFFTVE